ncbi:unnamed protein product [Protopolystoma xenopodis]|uniref:Uncharacterized protein n=1 Tax=Protopolystoma xenopodis TaxID=117903 RepID=A0A448WN37_9PLAT|nr:unnamed protein product [Protopolystoma xenopodis]
MVLQEKSAIYRVEFSTAEANIQPLYVYPRKELFVEPRDKATQLKSEEFMREDYDKNSSRLCMLKKSYEISENVTKKSRSTSPARKSLRVYKDELSSERPSSVSRAERVRTDGIIYVEFNGYMLKIRCDMLQTSKLRQPASKEIKEIIENLNMETTDQRKNKAEVVTRCGNDLLRVTFSMVDINVERAYLKEDVGLQTESENVYLRDRNLITGKTNFISVPESTYNYEDPMKQIHYIHLSFQGTDAIPLWKYNLMQERIAIARGSEELKRDHENAYKRTQGSKLIFEAFDALATVKMGQLCSEVAKGLLNYENSMANLHARRLGGNSLYSRRDEEPVLEESSQVNIVTTSNNFML